MPYRPENKNPGKLGRVYRNMGCENAHGNWLSMFDIKLHGFMGQWVGRGKKRHYVMPDSTKIDGVGSEDDGFYDQV